MRRWRCSAPSILSSHGWTPGPEQILVRERTVRVLHSCPLTESRYMEGTLKITLFHLHGVRNALLFRYNSMETNRRSKRKLLISNDAAGQGADLPSPRDEHRHSLRKWLFKIRFLGWSSPCPLSHWLSTWKHSLLTANFSQNEFVWERRVRSSSPTYDLTPPHQLTHGTECHVQSFLKHVQGW